MTQQFRIVNGTIALNLFPIDCVSSTPRLTIGCVKPLIVLQTTNTLTFYKSSA